MGDTINSFNGTFLSCSSEICLRQQGHCIGVAADISKLGQIKQLWPIRSFLFSQIQVGEVAFVQMNSLCL